MTRPDLRAATTPREALVAAVEQLRRIADALTTPTPRTAADDGRAIPPDGNAEDCPRCIGTNPPYPWVCPGHPARITPDNPAASDDSPPIHTWDSQVISGHPDHACMCMTAPNGTDSELHINWDDARLLHGWLTDLIAERAPAGHTSAASDDGLREQVARVICAQVAVERWDELTDDYRNIYRENADAILAVRDAELQQFRAKAARLEPAIIEQERQADRAATAEATLARINDLADRHPVTIDTAHLHAALDGAQAPTDGLSAEDWKRTATVNGALYRSAEGTVTRVIELAERWEQHGPPPFQEPLTELRAALNDQVARPTPVYDAVRDGHHDLDGEQPATWTPPPPGAPTEQLPDHILAPIRDELPDYLSTACQTADVVACAATYRHPLYDELRAHSERLHQRCRINQKFTGQLCVCGCHADGATPHHDPTTKEQP